MPGIAFLIRVVARPGMYGTEEFAVLLQSLQNEGYVDVSVDELQRKAGPGSHVERLCVLLSAIESKEEDAKAVGECDEDVEEELRDVKQRMCELGFAENAEVESANRALQDKLDALMQTKSMQQDVQAQWQRAQELSARASGQRTMDDLDRLEDEHTGAFASAPNAQSDGSISSMLGGLGVGRTLSESFGVFPNLMQFGGADSFLGGGGVGSVLRGDGGAGDATGTGGQPALANMEGLFNSLDVFGLGTGGTQKMPFGGGLPAIFEGALFMKDQQVFGVGDVRCLIFTSDHQ
jgi:hypothetical protein